MDFGLLKFLNNKYLADVTVKVEDTSFKAHKVVLAAGSAYYYRLFENDSKSEVSLPPYVEPKFGNVSVKSLFGDLLGYLYGNQEVEIIKKKINEETANCFLALGYSLGVQSLTDLAAEFIVDFMLCSRNCVDYLMEGIKFYSQVLIDAATKQVILNFQEVARDVNSVNALACLPFKVLVQVVSSDELKVDSEKVVFEVLGGICLQDKTKLKKEEIDELFKVVRWPFLTHSDLLQAASNPHFSICKDLILEGISVQLSEHIKAKDYEYKVIQTPRSSYTSQLPVQSHKQPSLEAPIRFQSKSSSNWKSFNKPSSDYKPPHPPQQFSKTFSKPLQEFIYSFDFDENGVFYFIGSSGRLKPWENPALTGKVLAFASSVSSGKVEDLVGREISGFRTRNEVNSFVGVDLGEGRLMRLTAYTLRNGNSSSNTMTCWNLQASVNGSDWVSVDRRDNRNSQELRYLREKGRTSTWGLARNEKAFRFFRVLQTEKNLADNWMISLSCFELYGFACGDAWEGL